MSARRTDYLIRSASINEIERLVELRLAMFEAMGVDEQALDHIEVSMRDYFLQHLPTRAFRVWVADVEGLPIASIGLVIHSVPPSPHNATGKEAYIMNLVTLPEYRRQGIAKSLLLHVVDIVRSEGIPKLSLHASPAGWRLYEGVGFMVSEELPEMWLTF